MFLLVCLRSPVLIGWIGDAGGRSRVRKETQASSASTLGALRAEDFICLRILDVVEVKGIQGSRAFNPSYTAPLKKLICNKAQFKTSI